VKKLFAIAFTCVYLLLTVGVVKSTHYCMGRINFSPHSSEVTTPPSNHLIIAPGISVFNKSKTYRAGFEESNPKNSAEFFIISDLYSEAFVIFVA
jgi:hypothetical protein